MKDTAKDVAVDVLTTLFACRKMQRLSVSELTALVNMTDEQLKATEWYSVLRKTSSVPLGARTLYLPDTVVFEALREDFSHLLQKKKHS